MKFKGFLILLFSVLISVFSGPISAGGNLPCPQGTIFKNIAVLSLQTKEILSGRDVLVCGDKIISVQASSKENPQENFLILDGEGKFLVPGLIDFHVHLQATGHLLSYLRYGVTTIVDASGNLEKLELREQIKAGAVLGPTFFVASRRFDGDPPVFQGATVIDGPETARSEVHTAVEAGFDFIKIYNNLTRENYKALMAEARKLGIAVIGHVPRAVGAEMAVEEGQALVLHGEEFYFTFFKGPRDPTKNNIVFPPELSGMEELVAKIASHGMAVAPNFGFVYAMQNQFENIDGVFAHPEFSLLDPGVQRRWRKDNVTRGGNPEFVEAREAVKIPFLKTFTLSLWKNGVNLIAGTDAEIPTVFPGLSIHDDIQGFVDSGIPALDALAAATLNPGKFLIRHIPNVPKLGIIEKGAQADLLLLSGNPLENLAVLKNPEGVMVRGKWLSLSKIDEMRAKPE